MTTNFKAIAYKITRCGYYVRASKTPLFGTIDQVLANLVSWVGGKSLSETKTFDVEGEDTLPVYCFDIRKAKNAGHYLLTTWNEVPMIDGGVPTANGSAKVGKVDVKLADVANGNIPVRFPDQTGH